MKSTSGVIRRIDPLGRVVIPKAWRALLGWDEHARIEVALDGERVILQRHGATCVFCGGIAYLTEYHGKQVCRPCIERMVGGVGK